MHCRIDKLQIKLLNVIYIIKYLSRYVKFRNYPGGADEA